MCNLMMPIKVKLHTFFREPLMLAIRRGDVQMVTELATSISSIQTHSTVEDWTALHEAAYYGQAACVKALLKGKHILWTFTFQYSAKSKC